MFDSYLADPVSLIVGIVVIALFLAVMLWDIWRASVSRGNTPDRCPRCGSRHHTDCKWP